MKNAVVTGYLRYLLPILGCIFLNINAVAGTDQIIGVCTHLGHHGKDIDKTLAAARSVGFTSIRDDVLWSHIETSKNELSLKSHHLFVDKANKAGMKVLIVLGYGNNLYGKREKPLNVEQLNKFKRYVDFVVSALRTKVWGYEIWNEYDATTAGYPKGGADGYAQLVNAIAPIIRSQDPNAHILAGAFTPISIDNGWVDKFLAETDLSLVDGISVHPYAQNRSLPNKEIEYALGLVNSVAAKIERESVLKRVSPPRIYVTEIGWQTADGISQEEASHRVKQFVDSIRSSSFVGGVWIYELENSGINNRNGEHTYGVFSKDFVNRRYPLDFKQTH